MSPYWAPNRAEGKNLPDPGLQRIAGTGSKETPETNFQTFPSFPQGDCNVCGCDTLASAEGSTCWVSGAALVRFGSNASVGYVPVTSGLPTNNGHHQTALACLKGADIVAKVFLEWRTKILRAADAF
jgi:uncharacterized Zn-binding protein involved in type VI secretion